MSTAINVGTPPEATKVVAKQIMSILNSGGDARNVQLALEILSKATKSPDFTNITNCTFNMDSKSE